MQGFNKKWLSEPAYKDWLIEVGGKGNSSSAKCKLCDCHFKNSNKSALEKHVGSVKHRESERQCKSQPNLATFLRPKSVNIDQKVAMAELKLAGYMAEHRVPFTQADHLSSLLPSMCPDSQISKNMHLTKTKASYVIQHGIAYHEKEELKETLKKQNISIMVDESTDRSVTQILAVVVRYLDVSHGETVDRLLGVIEVDEATAPGLYNAIKTC